MILSVESKQSGMLLNHSIEESLRMTHSVPLFRRTDMAHLCARQSMFISMLLGGRVVYTGKDMHAAHTLAREHGLNDVHFDRFLSHFREALKEVGVEAQKVEKVANLLETRRDAVLNP
jgi:hemoglobin